ncbi:MAG: hypothetical protein ACI80K_003134, partial [Paracoccaceae bacterium]
KGAEVVVPRSKAACTVLNRMRELDWSTSERMLR